MSYDRFYIKKIIRDDDTSLVFDRNEIFLTSDNTDLDANGEISSTEVDYTETDGGEMVHQRTAPVEIEFVGAIIPKATAYKTLRMKLLQFFAKNHTYEIIFIMRDGTMYSRKNAWLSKNIQLPTEANELQATFTFSMKIGDKNRYEYSEDADGNEILANTVELPLVSASSGGNFWDDIGNVYDDVGEVWEIGEGGVQEVNIASTSKIYPVWTVTGEAINPTLKNNTTDTTATYNGTVAKGQTLVVDFAAGTAYLNSALVTRNVTGQVSFAAGSNTVGFDTDGGNATKSTIKWNNIIG